MFCPNCGKEISDGALFCQSCGYKLNQEDSQNNAESNQKNNDSTVLWYYIAGNERKGPVTEQQVEDLTKSGIIARGTMVWREGFSGWLKVEDTALKYIVERIVPATPMNALSDKWLWALATVPLLVNFLLARFIPASASIVLTIIVIGLNILFLTLDTRDLRKNGVTPESWLWLGFLLVPVYLFVRGAKTTKNIAPGIVWCVLFVLSLFI